MSVSAATLFWSEFLGTATLILLGTGVVANETLPRTKGHGTGTLQINLGWGIAVFAGVYVSHDSGAHLNPAITLGKWVSGAKEFAPGVATTAANFAIYLGAQLLGAFVGAVIAYVAYKRHFDLELDPKTRLGIFATTPAIRSYGWNLLTEVIATFALVFVVLEMGGTPSGLGPLAVALLVFVIGAGLGGPTGYAINPARDLGPRIANAVLPARGGRFSDWRYAWVPIVGPLLGGTVAGLLAGVMG